MSTVFLHEEVKGSNWIEVLLEVTDYDLDCILSGAFEGGSNYWCDNVQVVNNDYKGAEFASEAISKGAEIDIFLNEINYDGTRDKYRLTKEKLLEGCKHYIAGTKDTKRRAWDPDAMDAWDYDMILQYAIFGEVVYG
tara:strand:+ start:936 stop:1346 length:411 start_codon:yes stop_codon:yes gene_type:complete